MNNNTKIYLRNIIYKERFLFKKVVDCLELPLIAFLTLFVNAYSHTLSNPIEKNLFLYSSYILPIIWLTFFLWGLSIKAIVYENGIYSNYSLKYRGTWHFKDVEDIYVAPFPYGGKKMRQVVLLLKNGEEKTVIAYDKDAVIDRFYEEAKKAFEAYKSKNKGESDDIHI